MISINDPSQFTIRVTGGDDAELAVSVQGKLYFNFCRAVGTEGAGGSNCLPSPLTHILAGIFLPKIRFKEIFFLKVMKLFILHATLFLKMVGIFFLFLKT